MDFMYLENQFEGWKRSTEKRSGFSAELLGFPSYADAMSFYVIE